MPDPADYSSQDEFMSDCVPMMVDEGHDQDQAVAACSSMWEEHGKAAHVDPRTPLSTSAGQVRRPPSPVALLEAKQDRPDISSKARVAPAIKTSPAVDRAWSVLTVKSVDAERRTIEGIASTPSVDRVGDIIEPLGAKFSLPMPLLWQHRSDEPVGHVTVAKATKNGISIKAQFARIDEPGELKNMVDKAWQAVKAGLVRGLSIGFKPIEFSMLEDNSGLRFSAWNWFELSLVTIPANADASITLVRSLDADLLAATGKGQVGSASGGATASSARPGASGKSVNLKRTGVRDMSKTIGEQLEALAAKRAATEARMNAIMSKAMEEGRSTDEAEREEFDNCEVELATLDGDLKRFKSLERANAASAKPVDGVKSSQDASDVRGGGHIKVTGPQLPKGIAFARVAKCIGIARGSLGDASRVADQLFPDDPRISNILKAAVSAGTTMDATWAGPLVSDEGGVFADFNDFLRPMTIVGKFGANGIPPLRNVPFRVPLGSQTTGGAGYWTGEAQSKGLTRFDFARTTLEPLKVANIAVVTEELLRSAALNAEMLLRDQLAAAIGARIDTDFIDPAVTATPNVRPASITNGVTPVASSGVTDAHVITDIQAIMQGFIDADNPPTQGVWIMASNTALALNLMQNALGQNAFPGVTMNGGTFAGLPVIVSEYVGTSGGSPNTKYVWLVNANQVWFADDGGVSVDFSREASLVMDSAPTAMHAAELGSPSAPLAASMVSMFQTNAVAFRAERTLNWKLARTSAVQGLSGVVWGS